MLNIIVFGPRFKDGLGGVSIFVRNLLLKQKDYVLINVYWREVVFNLLRRNWHINISSKYHSFLGFLLLIIGKRVLFYYHNDRVTPIPEYLLGFFGDRWRMVFVNHDMWFKRHLNPRVSYIPAFISVDNGIQMALKGRGDVNVVFALWNYDRKTANSIYGVDLLLRLVVELKPERVQWHFFVGKGIEQFREDISELKELPENISFYFKRELIDYLEDADILIRPNRKDGFGLVVQEAIERKCIALASDCCTRAEGAVLFTCGDYKSLKDNFLDVLENLIVYKSKIESTRKVNYLNSLNQVYKSLYETTDTKTRHR